MIHQKKGRAINFHGKSWIGRRYESESIRRIMTIRENRHDSDNETTFDSDNDSNIDGCDSDGQKQHLLSTSGDNILSES